MSEQDFFFDEEPGPKAAAAKGAKTPAATSAKTPAKTPATSSAKSAPKASPAVETTPSAGSFDQSTLYAIAALVGVIGLLLGATLGFLLGTTMASNSASSPSTSTAAPAASGSSAPALTQDQLTTTTLPAGHPQVNVGAAAGTTTTP